MYLPLSQVAAAREDVAKAVVDLMNDAEGPVRAAAARAVGGMGEVMSGRDGVVDGLARMLHDGEGSVRAATAEAIRGLGSEVAKTEGIVEGLAGLLNDASVDVRDSATSALFEIKEAVPEGAATELVRALKDAVDADARGRVVEVLGGVRNAMLSKEESVQSLLQLLTHTSAEVRSGEAEVLGGVGNQGAEVGKGLISLLRDSQGEVRDAAVQALTRGGPHWKGRRAWLRRWWKWGARCLEM